jgi:hypothetical protein
MFGRYHDGYMCSLFVAMRKNCSARCRWEISRGSGMALFGHRFYCGHFVAKRSVTLQQPKLYPIFA